MSLRTSFQIPGRPLLRQQVAAKVRHKKRLRHLLNQKLSRRQIPQAKKRCLPTPRLKQINLPKITVPQHLLLKRKYPLLNQHQSLHQSIKPLRKHPLARTYAYDCRPHFEKDGFVIMSAEIPPRCHYYLYMGLPRLSNKKIPPGTRDRRCISTDDSLVGLFSISEP